MLFHYTYKTSDNARHSDTIEAADRDAAFTALRTRGIRPMKVWAEEPVRRRSSFVSILPVVAVAAAFAWFVRPRPDPIEPMTRRPVTGNPARVEKSLHDDAFGSPAETYLVGYAIPGRLGTARPFTVAVEADFAELLDRGVSLREEDDAETRELRRIVAGMVEEARMFRAAGGTVREYALRLEERQKMEAEYRAKAAAELAEAASRGNPYDTAATWERLNDWLSAMGIEGLPAPR